MIASSTQLKKAKPRTRRRGEEGAVERIEMRVTPKDKKKVVHAAKKYGESATSFLMQAAIHEIERRERERELQKLSARDQQTFVQALFAPARVNSTLLAAARRYRDEFVDEFVPE